MTEEEEKEEKERGKRERKKREEKEREDDGKDTHYGWIILIYVSDQAFDRVQDISSARR